jgi:hypothetical protein
MAMGLFSGIASNTPAAVVAGNNNNRIGGGSMSNSVRNVAGSF